MKKLTLATTSLVLLLLLTFSFKPSEQAFVILVDPGHGGKDAGYVSDEKGLIEKDLTLNFIQRLIEVSRAYPDIKVISTRNGDEFLDLKERVAISKAEKANLFISIHMDAHNEATKQGMSLMIDENSKYKSESLALAETIISQLNSDASVNLQSDITDFDSYVLQNVDCPAIMLNLGFLSSGADADFINADDNIDALCKELIEALRTKE
jgi:N-acetylmuramoyl-L-alanine amidase